MAEDTPRLSKMFGFTCIWERRNNNDTPIIYPESLGNSAERLYPSLSTWHYVRISGTKSDVSIWEEVIFSVIYQSLVELSLDKSNDSDTYTDYLFYKNSI